VRLAWLVGYPISCCQVGGAREVKEEKEKAVGYRENLKKRLDCPRGGVKKKSGKSESRKGSCIGEGWPGETDKKRETNQRKKRELKKKGKDKKMREEKKRRSLCGPSRGTVKLGFGEFKLFRFKKSNRTVSRN